MNRRRIATIVFVLALAVFRVALTYTWHAPAGDGVQYYKLATELKQNHRFAFGPPPAPLSYARLPGYPLLMALVSPKGISLQRHILWAVGWNLVFDAITTLLGYLIVRRLGGSHGAGLVGVAFVALCPMSFLVSTYALTECVTAMLLTVLLYAVLEWEATQRTKWIVLASAAAALAQLMRFDSLTAIVAASVAFVVARVATSSKIRTLVLFGALTTLVFGLWPLRNYVRFGAPHIAATTWRTMDGMPLPTGFIEWARTWSASIPGDAMHELMIANRMKLDLTRPGMILPSMYDSEPERLEIVRLFTKYNERAANNGLEGEVDAGLRALAEARAKRAPFRTFVELPLRRMWRLWLTMPEGELPLRVSWFWMPQLRFLLDWVDTFITLLAFVGLVLLARDARRGGDHTRVFFAYVLLSIILRSVMFSIAIPHVATKRYLAEIFPLLSITAALFVTRAWRWWRQRRELPIPVAAG